MQTVDERILCVCGCSAWGCESRFWHEK
jgi:hypothetical protein